MIGSYMYDTRRLRASGQADDGNDSPSESIVVRGWFAIVSENIWKGLGRFSCLCKAGVGTYYLVR